VDPTNTRITAGLERKMEEAIRRYPADRKRSAAMPLLHLWQEEFGFISDEGVRRIAEKLELQPINILELVTFYPMYRQAPAGKKHLRVCRTLSCAMAGSYEVMKQACAAAGIVRHYDDNGMHNPISLSQNGEYSIEFVECLASCGTAPVCMVDDELIENVQSAFAADLLTAVWKPPLVGKPSPTRSNIVSSSRTSDAGTGRPTSSVICATAATNN
jgi:NADH-quinone oxidoreductase subunit E